MNYKVYLIENQVNGKKYVGYTSKEPKRRFYQHTISDKPIGKAIRKYGAECFAMRVIDETGEIEDVVELEKKWIAYYDSYNSGYNCTEGGDRSPVMRKNDVYKTKEFSDKVRENAFRQHSNPKSKQKHVDGIRNYWDSLSEEELAVRKQIAVDNGKKSKVGWNKGMKFPGSGLSGEKNPMAKEYRVWYPDGTEKVVNCLSAFCKENRLTYRNACYVVQGKQRHHKGFRFARLESHS
jgi:group I intron endonuclease